MLFSYRYTSPSPSVEGVGNVFRIVVLAVFKPNKIIRKHTDGNCSSFHLRVFLELSNPQGQRQTSILTSILSILLDNFRERNAKLNLETSRTTQMQLYKYIHVP
jgi:hypothetical protein